MENLPQIFEFFGMDPATMTSLALIIFALTEGIKSYFNGFLTGGWKSKAITASLSLLVTVYYFTQQPEVINYLQIILCTLLLIIFGAGAHRVVKKVETPPVG